MRKLQMHYLVALFNLLFPLKLCPVCFEGEIFSSVEEIHNDSAQHYSLALEGPLTDILVQYGC